MEFRHKILEGLKILLKDGGFVIVGIRKLVEKEINITLHTLWRRY